MRSCMKSRYLGRYVPLIYMDLCTSQVGMYLHVGKDLCNYFECFYVSRIGSGLNNVKKKKS